MRVHAFEQDLHPAALRRELDRVAQQVPDDLLQSGGVARNNAASRIENALEPNALRIRRRLDRFDRIADHVDQGHALHIEAYLAGEDAAQLQEVVDELDLRARVALDHVEALLHL
ncbi:MAG TPA: hypothetical protein VGL52_09935, partial [Casimicrobiaceae bacterium]